MKIKFYIDSRGWKYKVMSGLGEDNYKARYQKPNVTGTTGRKCMKNLPWRKTFYEAQEDLDKLAELKGWKCEKSEVEHGKFK